MNPKRKFTVDLFEEHNAANLYVVRFEDESENEFEKFINTFINDVSLREDLDRIIYWLDKIGEKGALERYFRPESKMKDDVNAIPVEVSALRLYCLRISDNILILGNGGHKPKEQHTYNTDTHLNNCVQTLASLDFFLKQKIARNQITIDGKSISGDLSFYLKATQK